MTVETAYNFLKPSLEQLTPEEKEELCRLISGDPKPVKVIRDDDVHSVVYYKKKLLKTVFNKKKKPPVAREAK